ncbi:serine hydrolase domain-containing protein [Flavobacterium selenitireducens]|uniref:serine hydrolase domain-containing protein n=1 Tax=Flavobacterium selenitireducens TaxID=2722704 RepID=UPI00168A7123|nr:serine hydrolase domain-containing protein [Flavobacterium selenitireducens]MBD3581909.1 beta-lactamase family protein [Flavobacterium selenitireducens]
MKRLLLLFMLAETIVSLAQKEVSRTLDRYMQAQATQNDFSGTVLVSQKGNIIYEKSFGLANREWNVPNSPETRYRICSLTKQFTAAAVLRLEEQGKLTISDKLSKYFPDYPKGDEVTLHMLLNHTSGIKDVGEIPKWFRLDARLPVEKMKDTLIAVFKDKPYDFEPGKGWHYSNSGYILLGYVIEQASGQPYYDYVREYLLKKASMDDSGFLQHDLIVPNLVNGYALLPSGWKRSTSETGNSGFSAGNMFATARDLFKWRVALQSGKIISAASLKKMNTPHHPERGAGYGIFVDNFLNHKVLEHQGAIEGFNTYMGEYIDDGVCIIVLTNRDTNLDFVPKGLAGIMFGRPVESFYKKKPVRFSGSVSAFAGEFKSPDLPFPVTVVEKDNKLYWRMWRDIELIPESQKKFFIDEQDIDIQLEYMTDGSGTVSGLYFISAGIRNKLKKA